MNNDGSPYDHLLCYFAFDHLPPHLQAVSKPFCVLARSLAERATYQGANMIETKVALRKLLESKDAAVRAALS